MPILEVELRLQHPGIDGKVDSVCNKFAKTDVEHQESEKKLWLSIFAF